MEYPQTLMRYTHTNNSLLSSGNMKKSTTYEPRTEAISPAINDDLLSAEDSTSKSTKDEQTLLVEKLRKVEADIVQTDVHIARLRRQKEQLEQAANSANKDDDDQENVCDTKQLSIAKLVYHENRSKAQRAHSKLDCLGGTNRDLPIYNQPTDNAIYHHNAAKFNYSFKASLVTCFRARQANRLKLEESVSKEYDRRMEKWLKSIELEDSQPSKRIKDAKAREFFEKQFPELKKARESGERFSRVGQRVARSDAEVAELLDGITEREDQDKKVKSYAVIPPMLEKMRSKKPKYFNRNGFVEDIIAEYKEYQILNTWTDAEKDIFRENYLQHPKDFGLISRMTVRKNVANCVHYYYLSKKSENYKQLLKRQQKRRTRSFVRPAQATPANNSVIENSDTNSKSTNNNEKQGGDSVMTESLKLSEQNDGKSSALMDKIRQNDLDPMNANEMIDQISQSCCVCNCSLDANNQFRNVTRSNHQIYGIGIDLLKPGLKICYSCRFRHVNYPGFDEITSSPQDQLENEPNIFTDMMEVDCIPEPEANAKPFAVGDLTNPLDIPQRPISPSKLVDQPELSSGPDNGELNKGSKRACVRDIIYQAIEMSFQKQEPTDTSDAQPKVEPIRAECVAPPSQPGAPVMPQHPVTSISGQMYSLQHPNSCYPPVQMMNPRQQLFDETSRIRQQQYHMEIRQQQPPQHHLRPSPMQTQPPNQAQPQQGPPRQQFSPIIHSQTIPSLAMPQQPILARLPSQPYPTTIPQPNPLTSAMQPPHPSHPLLTTVVAASSPHPTPMVRHPPALKTHGPATNHLPPGAPVAHPLNLCRKYSDPPFPPKEAIKQLQSKTRPPIAHSGKIGPSPGSIDDGVLNLSAKHQSSTSAPLTQPSIAQQTLTNAIQSQQTQPQQQPQKPPPANPNHMPPTIVATTQAQPSIPKLPPNQSSAPTPKQSTNPTNISPPTAIKLETPTNGEIHETNKAPTTPPPNAAISSGGPSRKRTPPTPSYSHHSRDHDPHSPSSPSHRPDSPSYAGCSPSYSLTSPPQGGNRTPSNCPSPSYGQAIGSPTSPSEMVIDESAEALASPSDHDEDDIGKK